MPIGFQVPASHWEGGGPKYKTNRSEIAFSADMVPSKTRFFVCPRTPPHVHLLAAWVTISHVSMELAFGRHKINKNDVNNKLHKDRL